MTPFFTQFELSHTSNNTTFQNIGGTNARAVPHLTFWGYRPPSPPKSPPMRSFTLIFALTQSLSLEFTLSYSIFYYHTRSLSHSFSRTRSSIQTD